MIIESAGHNVHFAEIAHRNGTLDNDADLRQLLLDRELKSEPGADLEAYRRKYFGVCITETGKGRFLTDYVRSDDEDALKKLREMLQDAPKRVAEGRNRCAIFMIK